MNTRIFPASVLAAGLLLAGGCAHSSYLDARYIPDRADYGDRALPPAPPPAPHVDIINPTPTGPGGQIVEDVITGTWTFVTPPTVTRVEHKTDNFSQFSLYYGRPGPNDLPFVVITVSNDPRGIAQSDPATYKIANDREYTLNGSIAHEWTGNTKSGSGFCEMLIRKPAGSAGPGEICHAMATVKTEDERKLALDILASIKWTPSGPTTAP
jgi:hypothetical protein